MSAETSIPLPRLFGGGLPDITVMETLLADAPIGFAVLSPAPAFRLINPALAGMYGRSPQECLDRSPAQVLDPEGSGGPGAAASATAQEAAIAAVLGGTPVVHSRYEQAPNPLPGRWELTWFPTRDADGEIDGVAVVAVQAPGTPLDGADRAVVDQLRSAREREDAVLRRDEERFRTLLQASNQIVWVAGPSGDVHEDCPQWRAITGQDLGSYLGRGWLDAVHPDDRARLERAWDDAVADVVSFDMTFRARTKAGDYRHYRSRANPITQDGTPVEWVGTIVDATTQREAEEMRRRLNQQLSEAAMRTVRLQKATSDLAEALTVEEVVRAMSEIGREDVGVDRTAVALLDGDGLRLRVVNPDGVAEVPGSGGRSFGLDFPSIAAKAVLNRQPHIACSPADLRELLEDAPETVRFLEHTDEKAWVALPMMAAGRPIGALRFAFTSPREITDEDRVFLEALAGQCALAIGRATLYEREHGTAEALQRSLLPEELPEVRGVGMAAFYRSGTQHVQVGGDWYDAFPLPDGRIAGVLGDVMGKGIPAATGMGRVRNALRALAFSMPEPADVLTGLDRMFDATEGMDQVTTLVYFVLDPVTGRLELSNAGHLPPLVLTGGAAPALLETDPDTPLGVSSKRGHHKFFVQPGNTVVLYSDGLVENRRRSVAAGLEELVNIASQAPPEVVGDPQDMLEYLVESMLAGYEQDDDVTLLAVQLPVIEAAPEQ